MKLLRVIHSLNAHGGGPSEGIRQVTPHLDKHDVHTTVLSLDSPESRCLKNQPFTAHGLGPGLTGYGFRPGLSKQIRELALAHDAVIIHGLWQYHAFATWRALYGTDIPYFVYPHGMLDPWFKRAYPLKHLKKLLYWTLADHRVLRDAQAVLFTTESERILAHASFPFYQVREQVVGYGTSLPPNSPHSQLDAFYIQFPQLRHHRLLLYLGRIHPKKGLDLLLVAFSRVAFEDPLLHLVIAGPDQVGLQQSLEQLAYSLGISNRITWTGMLSGDAKWGAYRAAELFCLPSHQENFGIVVAEALATGTPVMVATPVNISQDVHDHHAGLVHPDTHAGTSNSLRSWMALSRDQQVLFSVNAERLFHAKYDLSNIADNLLRILHPNSL
jgi:glycosyltransferase involved in cell wall biosynthesis